MELRKKSIACVTIVTPNYLPQALVLMASIDSSLIPKDEVVISKLIFILGGDNEQHHKLHTPDIDLVSITEYIDSSLLSSLIRRYTPSEICWALKPLLVLKLLNSFDQVYYFDADILLYADFSYVVAELGDANIMLTPHYLDGFPDDGLAPNELTLLRSGTFNAGFFAVQRSQESLRFLHWWANRVVRFGRNDPKNGMCGDQKWLNLVPILFEGVKVCQHRGFNVAYWNMHERKIQKYDHTLFMDQDLLIFIHYSGFNFNNPSVLSIHQNRISVVGLYQELCSQYALLIEDATRAFSSVDLNFYQYKKWWHSRVKLYRKVQDFFKNPRK